MSYRDWLSEIGIGLGVVIAILLALNFAEIISSKQIAASDKVEQTSTEQQPTDKAAEETQFRMSPLSPTNPTREEHNGGSAQNGHPQAENHLFWGDGIAQWVMAGTGFLALAISAWAVWLVSKTLKITRETLKEAQDATKAAEAAVEVTKITSEKQLRAYMNVFDCKLIYANQSRLRAHIVFKNFGNTPAYNVVNCMQARFSSKPLTEFPLDKNDGNQGVVGPTAMFTTVLPLDDPPLPPEKMDMLKKNQAVLYVYGVVTYEDAFKQSRYTKYRLMFGGEAEVLEDLSLATCPEGNEAT